MTEEQLKSRVNWGRGTIVLPDGQFASCTDFIDWCISQGYNQFYTRRQGAAWCYFLHNAEGTYYTFKRKAEADYIASRPGVETYPRQEEKELPVGEMPKGELVDLYSYDSLRGQIRDNVAFSLLQGNTAFYPLSGYKWLIGRTRYNNGIALVWEERYLTKEILKEIHEELRAADLNRINIRVYGWATLIFSQNVEFYQFPLKR